MLFEFQCQDKHAAYVQNMKIIPDHQIFSSLDKDAPQKDEFFDKGVLELTVMMGRGKARWGAFCMRCFLS